MNNVATKCLLLRCRTEYPVVEATRISWYKVSCGLSAAGPLPFRCNFISCRVAEKAPSDPDTLIVLQYERQPYIKTRRGLPFGGPVTKGMFTHKSHWDAAADLLNGAVMPCAINFEKMLCSFRSGDKLTSLGVDEAIVPRTFDLHHSHAPASGGQQTMPTTLHGERGCCPSGGGTQHLLRKHVELLVLSAAKHTARLSRASSVMLLVQLCLKALRV